MAYFPDMTSYSYGSSDAIEGGRDDLNVGWLSRDHEFTRGSVPPGLVESLLICVTRRVRLYRGFHSCEFCDVGVATMNIDGREMLLGNGEIRVRGADHRWYTAPTLVAHYVDCHQYQPPSGFVDGVIARARTLYVLRGPQRERLSRMSVDDRLETCLRLLRQVAASRGLNVDSLVPQILDAAGGDPDRDTWRDGWKTSVPSELAGLDKLVADACCSIITGFSRQRRAPDEIRDQQAMWTVTRLLETAADNGLDVSGY